MPEESFDSTLFADQAERDELGAIFNAGKKNALEGKPEGTFQAIIEKADVGKATSSGRLQIEYNLKLVTGPAKDTVLQKYDGLQSEKSVEIAMSQLERLGVDLKKLTPDNLRATVKLLEGQMVQINCKQNGEFYNIYFQKVIKKVQPGTTAPGGSAPKKF
ncbi:MAG: hypothetical protein M0R74_14150 [Dehalococcoidia bacterium]|nr:hypothetical protein [Dehalococcoidia bacterium]